MISSSSNRARDERGGISTTLDGLERGLLRNLTRETYENLEAGRVARQFEETQYANDGEELEYVRVVNMVS